MLPVAIIVPPPGVGAAEVRAVEEACSSAVRGQARCRAVSPGAVPSDTVVEVSLVWLDESRRDVLVVARGRGVTVARERRITFSTADPEVERWRAIGFAIATLVEDFRAAAITPPPASAAAAPGPAPTATVASSAAPPKEAGPSGARPLPDPAPPPPRIETHAGPTRPVFVSLVGKALTAANGVVVAGPELRFAADVGAPYEATLAVGTTVVGGNQGQLSSGLTWFSGGFRTTLWTSLPMRYWIRAEVLVEELRLEASDVDVTDSADKWQIGGLFATGFERRFGRFSIGAAVEVGVRSSVTNVQVERVEIAHVRPLRPALELGLGAQF